MQIIYRYDGSFSGLLCCVFESFYKKEEPFAILSPSANEVFLCPEKEIFTDEEKAARVAASIPKKISKAAEELVYNGYLCCHPQKEKLILDFLKLGFRRRDAADILGHPVVSELHKAVSHMYREAHQLLGFTRFSIGEGGEMTAIVEPKNQVLPVLARHFRTRYPQERFLIYDKTHKIAYLYLAGEEQLIEAENFALPPLSNKEQAFRALWKRYYDTIAIKERKINPRCRMSHMPKRYWKHLTEMQSETETVRLYGLPSAARILPE